ncbi:MAG TPA: HEAT repeat domain-containing protein, partial [Verrucomicrobiae bacterium]|nr:HEAT repeat domain-containing protein [Verrucomicrobiae bacterium]
LRTLDDDRQWVARPGISALATIGPLARDAVPKLLPWLHGQKTDHGREAIKALSLIAPRDAAVLEGFATALGHEQFLFRAATAEALGEALPDERAGALLVRAASDRSHYVRLAAVRSLARASVPPPAFLAALENARHDRFPSVRAAAVETLKAWEKKASSKNTLETSRR